VSRRNVVVISLFLALAVVLGLASTLRTTHLGTASAAVPQARIDARTRQLDRLEARLAREAARRPPALPAAGSPVAAPEPRTVYVRPAPVVRVLHHRGEHEDEHEVEHGAEQDD
jgi:hypothetical protein